MEEPLDIAEEGEDIELGYGRELLGEEPPPQHKLLKWLRNVWEGRPLDAEPPPRVRKLHAGVLGSFKYPDDLMAALDGLDEAGEQDYCVYSPIPLGEIRETLATPVSPVRRFTLAGGIIGCLSGFALTILTSLHWPLRTSAKPIVSMPPFLIICFELTILLGALCTILGLIIYCVYPGLTHKDPYDEDYSYGTFGVFVRCPKDRHSTVKGILREAGADEVRYSRS